MKELGYNIILNDEELIPKVNSYNKNDIQLFESMLSNYIPDTDIYLNIFGYDIDNLKGLIKTEFNGCIYLGYKKNPYYMLYDIVEINYDILELHENTVMADQNIFLNGNNYYINKMVINEKFSGHLHWIQNLNIDTLLIKSKNKVFLTNSLLGIKNISYICAPHFKLSDFYESKLKTRLVAGYIKMINENYELDNDVIESYEKYIRRNSTRLYDYSLNNPMLLDYLIQNKLILKDYLYGLIKKVEVANDEVFKKLEKYAYDCYNIDIEKIKKPGESFIEIERRLKENVCTNLATIEVQDNHADAISFRKFKGKNSNYSYDNGDEFELSFQIRKKYENYLREMIHKGDLYVARYKSEVLVLEVIQKGNRYYPRTLFDIIDYYEINGHSNLLQMYCEQDTYEVEEINKISNDNEFVILNSLFLNDRVSAEGVKLYPEFGLFKYNYYNGKIYEINNIINSNDIIIDKLAISFFENYFLLPVPDKYIDDSFNPFNDYLDYVIFRKVNNPDNINDQVLNLKCDLLVDAIDLKCAIQAPYVVIDKVNDVVTNKKGNCYLVKDLFKFVSKFLTLGSRNASSRQIITLFSDYFQKDNENKYQNFTSKEIMDFVNKYFAFDVVQGTYIAHDSIIEFNAKFICYDKMWFKIFYDAVKKSKKQISKCSDIVVPVNKKSFFRQFTILEEEIPFYVECVKSTSSFEQFCDLLEEYYIYKIKPLLN